MERVVLRERQILMELASSCQTISHLWAHYYYYFHTDNKRLIALRFKTIKIHISGWKMLSVILPNSKLQVFGYYSEICPTDSFPSNWCFSTQRFVFDPKQEQSFLIRLSVTRFLRWNHHILIQKQDLCNTGAKTFKKKKLQHWS